MSEGLVICSECKREVFQAPATGEDGTRCYRWYHHDDGQRLCEGATARYPKSLDEVASRSNPEQPLKKTYIHSIFTAKDYERATGPINKGKRRR